MFNDPVLVGNTLIVIGYVSEVIRHLGHLRPHGRFTWGKLRRMAGRMALPVLGGLALTAGYALAVLGKLGG